VVDIDGEIGNNVKKKHEDNWKNQWNLMCFPLVLLWIRFMVLHCYRGTKYGGNRYFQGRAFFWPSVCICL